MLRPEDVKEPFAVGEFTTGGLAIVVPYLEIVGEIDGKQERITLHWGNTVVRTFYFQEELNHAEYRHNTRLMGLRLDKEILDAMLEYYYPLQADPILDEATMAWVASIETRGLDAELDELS